MTSTCFKNTYTSIFAIVYVIDSKALNRRLNPLRRMNTNSLTELPVIVMVQA